jgi:hypothetical protein
MQERHQDRHGSAKAVADDRRPVDPGAVKCFARGDRVAGQIGGTARSVPARPVDGDRRGPAEQGLNGRPLSRAARLPVQQQNW